MTRSIQVLCKSKEEMNQIKLELMKEFDGLYDFNETFIVTFEGKCQASFPEIPKENEHVEKLKNVSKKFTGIRFTFADATIDENGETVQDYENYVNGECTGSVSVW